MNIRITVLFLLFLMTACAGSTVNQKQESIVVRSSPVVSTTDKAVEAVSETVESEPDKVPEENRVVEIAPGIYRQFIPHPGAVGRSLPHPGAVGRTVRGTGTVGKSLPHPGVHGQVIKPKKDEEAKKDEETPPKTETFQPVRLLPDMPEENEGGSE